MITGKDFSSLLALLYAAPLEDEKWQIVLTRLAEITQASTSVLLCQDFQASDHSILAFAGPEADPEPQRLYNEHYGQFDPFRSPLLLCGAPPTGLIHGDSLIDRSLFKKGQFYNELLRDRGMEFAVMMIPPAEPRILDLITLWRGAHQGPMERDSLDLLTLLMPHVQSALKLRRRIKASELQTVRAEATLDKIASATILLDPRGRVCLMNLEAERIIRQQDGLHVSRGYLRTSSSNSQKDLDQLILRTGAGNARSQGSIKIARRSAKIELQILVSPVKLPNQEEDAPWHVLVVINDPEVQPRSYSDTLNVLYGFTPAEAAIANSLLSGLSLEEISDQREVSICTVRSQLKSLLAKTGTSRQSVLMRTLANTPRVSDLQL